MTLETNNQAQIDALNQKILDLPNLVSNGFLTTEQAEAKKEEFEEEILKLEGGLDISTEQPVDHDEQVSETEDAAQSAGFTDMADSDEDSDPDNLTQLNGDTPVDEDEFENSQSPEDEAPSAKNVQQESSEPTVLQVNGFDAIECDPEIAEQMKDNLKVIESFTFTDDAVKNFFAILPKAACLAKWVGECIVTVGVKDKAFASKVAETFLLPSFNNFISDRELSKEMKLAQYTTKYLPISIVPREIKRNTELKIGKDVIKDEDLKQGFKLIAHDEALKYNHSDFLKTIAFDKIFENEVINTEKDGYKASDTLIRGIGYKQQMWIESNEAKIIELVELLKAKRPDHIDAKKYQSWLGVLLIARLWDKAIFESIWNLMLSKCGSDSLEIETKLACALFVVVPEVETFLDTMKCKDIAVSTTLLKGFIKSTGFAESDMSYAFTKLNIALKDNKGGFTVEALKTAYTPKLKFEDKRVKDYLAELKRPQAA